MRYVLLSHSNIPVLCERTRLKNSWFRLRRTSHPGVRIQLSNTWASTTCSTPARVLFDTFDFGNTRRIHTSPGGRLKRHNLRDYVVLGTRLKITQCRICAAPTLRWCWYPCADAGDVGFPKRGKQCVILRTSYYLNDAPPRPRPGLSQYDGICWSRRPH